MIVSILFCLLTSLAQTTIVKTQDADSSLRSLSKQVDSRTERLYSFSIKYVRRQEILDESVDFGNSSERSYFLDDRHVHLVIDGKNVFSQYADSGKRRPTVIYNDKLRFVTLATPDRNGLSATVGFRNLEEMREKENTFVDPWFFRAFGVAFPRRFSDLLLEPQRNPIRQRLAGKLPIEINETDQGYHLIFRDKDEVAIVDTSRVFGHAFVKQVVTNLDGNVLRTIESKDFQKHGENTWIPNVVEIEHFVHWAQPAVYSNPIFREHYELEDFQFEIDPSYFEKSFLAPGVEVLDKRTGEHVQYVVPVDMEDLDIVIARAQHLDAKKPLENSYTLLFSALGVISAIVLVLVIYHKFGS